MRNLHTKIRRMVVGLVATFFILIAVAPAALAASDQSVSASPCRPPTGVVGFLGIPDWWEFLPSQQVQDSQNPNGRCAPAFSSDQPDKLWGIGLAAIDILLHVAGIVAVISILISSVMYVTSAGSPDRTKAALDRIISSLVGLAIALVAATAVKFIGYKINAGSQTGFYSGLPVTSADQVLKSGLDIFFGLIGVIAFLLIVIAGFNFVLSQGNPDKTARARNTIIYAAVGLVIAVSAAFIVSIVIGQSS